MLCLIWGSVLADLHHFRCNADANGNLKFQILQSKPATRLELEILGK